ncbi:MAG: hypothetical protein Phyf2KO_02190 [Phycisphaerales bacterium]
MPVVGGIAVYLRVKKSLSEIASVVEAVRLAPDAAVSETELLVAETETGPGKAWNSLVKSRFHGEHATVSDTVTEQGHSDDSLTKLAVDSHSDAMCLVDRSGKVVLCNAAAKQFFGSDDRVVAGELIKELVEGDVYSSIEDVLSGKVQRKNSVELSRQNENNQNEAVYRFVITPINGDARAAASIVVQDVTRQRLAERGRHDFLAQATHELRTPLTNIRLYIDEAIEAGDEDPKGRAEAINVISHESQRLERIVAELLDISELEAGARVVDLGDVRIEQLLDNLKSDYVSLAESKGVSITFELPPKIPVLRGDREKIAAALHNLVGNAVKYTPSGGSVVVRAEDGEGVLRITVEDTGIGISPAEQEKVYEKFFRSDDARVSQIEGTGLGLAFAKQVAEMHGGELSLDSELNKGSTFTLAMPKPKMAA